MEALRYAIIFWQMAKKSIDKVTNLLTSGLKWKGAVNYVADLPATPSEGDCYTVKYTGTSGTEAYGAEYAYGMDTDGTYKWIPLGPDKHLHMNFTNGRIIAVEE